MFEELYTPLPDTDAYLHRIHAAQEPCSLSALDHLIRAHQLAVPFENLDQYNTKQTASCSIKDLYEKIVVRKRGGYCFEQNALFLSLLQSLGYQAWSAASRIIRGKDLSSPILILHRINLVRLEDGLYFCDVGYGGPMPAFALKVEEGSQRSVDGETFYIRKQDSIWWKLGRITSQNAEEDILLFRTEPMENCDFFVLNHYASTSPLSVFTNHRMVNRRTEEGNVNLMDSTLTITERGSSRSLTIESEEQLKAILDEYFGIVI